MSRTVTLVLATPDGVVLGALPPFHVELPYWQEVRTVVDIARARHGLEVSVLRLLSTEPGRMHGGPVSYLAEVGERPTSPLTPVGVDVAPHPLRADYASFGGPARTLAWARSHVSFVTAEQQRTWNLSAIWRLETGRDPVWLKQVPRFFRHEAAVLSYLDQVRAWDGEGRMLLDHIEGTDLYGADLTARAAIALQHFEIQARALGDIDKLIAAGVPDRRDLSRLPTWPVPLGEQPWLAARLETVARAGMPATLVHGDLHPGNVIGTPRERTIIDWGDSFIGHPGFDILRLTERVSDGDAHALIAEWADRWRALVPGCDPIAAIEALRPIAALRNASVYAHFLANIEPSEHPYHVGDVPHWLAEADRLAGRWT